MALAAKIAAYVPSMPEFLLGIGGVAVALIITAVGVRVAAVPARITGGQGRGSPRRGQGLIRAHGSVLNSRDQGRG